MIKLDKAYNPLFSEIPKHVRYIILTGGRGSGKSFVAELFTKEQSYKRHSNILYSRYTYSSARRSIIQGLNELILSYRPMDFNIIQTETTNKLTGCKLWYSGLKASEKANKDRLKSIKDVTLWVMEEANELEDETQFNTIDLSIRSQKDHNLVLIIFNPPSVEHWLYKKFFSRKGLEDAGFNGIIGNTLYIHTDFRSNPNLDEGYINLIREMRARDYELYRHLFLGKFRKNDEHSVFKRNWFVYYKEQELPQDLVWNFVVDGAYTKDTNNDPTGILCFAQYKNNLYFRVCKTFHANFTDACEIIASFVKSFGYNLKSRIFVEPKASGLPMIDLLKQQYGLNAIKSYSPSKDKISYANEIAPIIQAGRVLLNSSQDWDGYLNNMIGFPYVKHDEEVDLTNMACKLGFTKQVDNTVIDFNKI